MGRRVLALLVGLVLLALMLWLVGRGEPQEVPPRNFLCVEAGELGLAGADPTAVSMYLWVSGEWMPAVWGVVSQAARAVSPVGEMWVRPLPVALAPEDLVCIRPPSVEGGAPDSAPGRAYRLHSFGTVLVHLAVVEGGEAVVPPLALPPPAERRIVSVWPLRLPVEGPGGPAGNVHGYRWMEGRQGRIYLHNGTTELRLLVERGSCWVFVEVYDLESGALLKRLGPFGGWADGFPSLCASLRFPGGLERPAVVVYSGDVDRALALISGRAAGQMDGGVVVHLARFLTLRLGGASYAALPAAPLPPGIHGMLELSANFTYTHCGLQADGLATWVQYLGLHEVLGRLERAEGPCRTYRFALRREVDASPAALLYSLRPAVVGPLPPGGELRIEEFAVRGHRRPDLAPPMSGLWCYRWVPTHYVRIHHFRPSPIPAASSAAAVEIVLYRMVFDWGWRVEERWALWMQVSPMGDAPLPARLTYDFPPFRTLPLFPAGYSRPDVASLSAAVVNLATHVAEHLLAFPLLATGSLRHWADFKTARWRAKLDGRVESSHLESVWRFRANVSTLFSYVNYIKWAAYTREGPHSVEVGWAMASTPWEMQDDYDFYVWSQDFNGPLPRGPEILSVSFAEPGWQPLTYPVGLKPPESQVHCLSEDGAPVAWSFECIGPWRLCG